MRCKNCKTQIDNPNLLRCPKCGKQLPKKKEHNIKKILLTSSFSVISLFYIITCFFSLFFTTEYLSKGVLIVQLIIFLMCVPFVFGNEKELNKRHMNVSGIILSCAFLANYIIVFKTQYYNIFISALSEFYFLGCMLLIILTLILFILNISGIIKKPFAFSFVSLFLALAGTALTILYFSINKVIVPYAILILVLQSFVPGYMGFHVLMKQHLINK